MCDYFCNGWQMIEALFLGIEREKKTQRENVISHIG